MPGKILVSFYQLITKVDEVYQITLPAEVQQLMSWFSPAPSGDLPRNRQDHGAVMIGHKMVIFGGWNSDLQLMDCHVLDAATRARGERNWPRT